MKITRPPALISTPSSNLAPVPHPGPADSKQTTGGPDRRQTAALLQALRTLSAQTAELSQAAAAPITDQLALSFAASLTAAWLQPPDSNSTSEGDPSIATDPNPNPNLNPPSPVCRMPFRGAEPNPQSAIRNPQSPDSSIRNPQPPDSSSLLQRLKEFSPFLVLLRRGDHHAQWLEIQRQWHALSSQRHRDHLAAQKAKTEVVPRSLRDDGGFSQETLAKTIRALNLF